MKNGIFGGTFNPPHNGHLIVAEHVRNALSLDTILFIPSYISPHKQKGEEANASERLHLTELAIKTNPRFRCSNFEINKKETSYSIHTIEHLLSINPSDQLFLLIGMDNYLTFHLWKEPKRILQLAALVVMTRPGFEKQINPEFGTDNIAFIEVPKIDISSSDIRQRLREHRSINGLVPPEVEDYIAVNRLYG